MSEWNPSLTRNWWTLFTLISDTQPENLPEIESPRLLRLVAEPASLLAAKAHTTPHSETPKRETNSSTVSVPSPSMGEAEVRAFLFEHHAKASRGDVAGMMSDYAQMVDFLDKGRIPATQIESDEAAHRKKWHKGTEEVVGLISVINQSGVWNANYTISFSNESAVGDWHKGQAELSMTVKNEGGRLYITAQRASIYNVSSSKQTSAVPPPTPSAPKQPNGISITVPKPYFITKTQASDMRQIEFIDQISFVKGITWHRTYRELAPDGKVLNTCRAIYNGRGGVSQDRRSAQIYVGSQSWERALGTQEFVRSCESNAASMVGEAFNFQFTQEGMLEPRAGISFRLQK